MAEDAKSGRGKHPRPPAYGISVLCLFRSAAFAGLRAHFRAGLAGSGRAALRAGFALCAGRAGGSGAFRLRRGRGGARAVAVRHQRGDLLPVHSGLVELNPFHGSGLLIHIISELLALHRGQQVQFLVLVPRDVFIVIIAIGKRGKEYLLIDYLVEYPAMTRYVFSD